MSDYALAQILAAVIYVLATVFIYLGNSVSRIARWARENPLEALGELTYAHPFFYLFVGALFWPLGNWFMVGGFLLTIAVGLALKPAGYEYSASNPPPRVKLPLNSDKEN